MAKNKAPQFAPIPMRALRDDRLHRTHLAVLGAIGYFDRGGKNGMGCYAMHETIAGMAGCNRWSVSRCQKQLQEFGYLRAVRQKDRRRYQYHVIPDAEGDSCATGHISRGDSCVTAQLPESDSCATAQPSTPDSCATAHITPEKRDPQRTQRYIYDEEIPQSVPSSSGESEDEIHPFDLPRVEADLQSGRNPAEAAAAEAPAAPPKRNPEESAARAGAPAAPDSDCDMSDLEDGELWAYQRRVSRYIKDGGIPTQALFDDVGHVYDWISSNLDDIQLSGAFDDLLCRMDDAIEGQRDAA